MRWDDEDVVVPWWQARSLSTSTAAMGWRRRRWWVHSAKESRYSCVRRDFAEEPRRKPPRTSPGVLRSIARAAGGVYVETVKVAISASWYSKVDAASEPFRYELLRCFVEEV